MIRLASALLLLALTAACGDNRTFPDRAAYAPATVQPLSCVPNLDGKIDANEMQAALGVAVSFLVSPAGEQRGVDVAGQINAQGHRVWKLSADYASDQVLKIEASAVQGKWYASSFPSGQFVTPLDSTGLSDAVYMRDDTGLYLLGYASKVESPAEGKTLVTYTAPVALYRFPIEAGKQWVSIGEVRSATVRGLPYAGRDTYSIAVDATGELQLPDLTFTQALRSRTSLVIEPLVGKSISRKQVSWLFECFGEVARATSLEGEPLADFTTTSELRRLGY